MKKVVILIVILLFSEACLAQETLTSLQSVYDLGLVSFEDPFLANRNNTLLLKMNQFQVGVNFQQSVRNRSIISIAGPIGHQFAMGMCWERSYYNRLNRGKLKIAQYTENQNIFSFSLAHAIRKNLKIGHQVTVFSNVINDATLMDWEITDIDSLWDKDSYDLKLSYRTGLLWELSTTFKLGLFFPVIIGGSLLETRIAKFETRTRTDFMYWGKSSWPANLPELALEHSPITATAFVFAIGKEKERPFFHFGGKTKIANKLLLACGYERHEQHLDKFLTGLGSYYRGFHAFYSYDLSDGTHRMALSFSPAREQQLIQLLDLQQHVTDIFPYKLKFYSEHVFVSGNLRNTTSEVVDIRIELYSPICHKLSQSLHLSSYKTARFQFNFSQLKNKIATNSSFCQLRIIAFQKGKQIIEKSFPIKILDIHQWNGELEDLVYFVQPNAHQVVNLAKMIIQGLSSKFTAVQCAAAVFDYLSRNLKYVPDPTPGAMDYVYFPQETMERKACDCEDLSVLYCSLLGACGIQTALVEIKPDKNHNAHIFILFDSGLKPEHINFLQENMRQYVFRKNSRDEFTAWIPVEMTLLGQRFEIARAKGAENFYSNGISKGGIAEGRVNIVDVY